MASCCEGDAQLRKQAWWDFPDAPLGDRQPDLGATAKWAASVVSYRRCPQTEWRSIGFAYHADMYAGIRARPQILGSPLRYAGRLAGDVAASMCTIAGSAGIPMPCSCVSMRKVLTMRTTPSCSYEHCSRFRRVRQAFGCDRQWAAHHGRSSDAEWELVNHAADHRGHPSWRPCQVGLQTSPHERAIIPVGNST